MIKHLTEVIINDIKLSKNSKNNEIIKNIIKNINNIDYIWTKIPVLLEKIRPMKGYITISNSEDKIKIDLAEDKVSERINEEFYETVKIWARKYKIELEYNYEKNNFYIK